jgi:5-methylcytosine-specific restriction endonuclease McrA
VTAFPKPPRRGPKPRRPIPRRSGRGKRFNPFAEYNRLEKLCDDTYALIIRLRGFNRCKLCGTNSNTQCAHLISRRYHAVRHALDPQNAWCLCARCHTRWTHDPLGWDELMERTFGVAEWARRKAQARVPCRPDYSLMRVPLRLLLVATAANGTYGLDAQVEKVLRRHDEYEER